MLDHDYSFRSSRAGLKPISHNRWISCAVIVSPIEMENRWKMIKKIKGLITVNNCTTGSAHEQPHNLQKRMFRNCCDLSPEPRGGVSVINTENFISIMIQSLHHLELIKFELKAGDSWGRAWLICWRVTWKEAYRSTFRVIF